MIAGTVFFFFFLETTALLGDILIKVSNNLCVCVCNIAVVLTLLMCFCNGHLLARLEAQHHCYM